MASENIIVAPVKCWKTFFITSVEGQSCFHHVKEVFSFGKCKISSYFEWRLISTAGKRKPVKRAYILIQKKWREILGPIIYSVSLYFLRKNLCRFYSKSNMMIIKVLRASRKQLKGNAFFRSISTRTSI